MKTVFISYHFKDASYKGEIQKWLIEAGANVISVDENDYRPDGPPAIKQRIREQVESSDLVLILVGNDTHNRPWVDYEVSVAKNYNIPVNWVRLSNRTGAAPKEVRNLPSVLYDRMAIVNLLKE